MADKDYYSILGLGESASEAEIKSAYRKLALKYHPDKNPGDKKAEDMFKKVSEAFYTLGDPARKQKYDNLRRMGGYTGDFSEDQGFDFSEFLKGFGGGRKGFSSGSIFGDLFGDIFSGSGGAGRRGGYTYYYSDGSRPGRGGQGMEEEVDTDITAVLPIPAKLADKGGEAKFRLSSGKTVTLKIPAGTRSGQKMRLRCEGEECHTCRHKGDLIVTIKIK